ncbi:MAG: MFS transporter [Sphingomicrobium sp.]
MATLALRRSPAMWLVPLLATSVLLNYVDRGAIGVAAPLMKDELGLTATGFGVAVSAFFWVYAPLCVAAGLLCDRMCVYRLFAAGVTLWALSTLATGFTSGLAMLIVLRLLLGLGESIAFPGCSKIIAAEVPPERRGSANSMVAAAIAFGPAVGTLAGGMIMIAFGWRAIFMIFGLITLMWLMPWQIVSRPLRAAAIGAPVIAPYPLGRLLRLPALWLMGIGHFFSNYGFYFLLAWLPLWLVKTRGYSIPEMTALTTLGFAAQGIAALALGRASDRWVARGTPEGPLRKSLMAIAQLASALAIIGIFLAQSTVALAACLIVAGIAASLLSTNLYCLAQMFSGPRAAGSWVGVQNALGNVAGIVGPIVTGLIVDFLGGYGYAFAVAAAVSAFGALWWWLVVPRVELLAVD